MNRHAILSLFRPFKSSQNIIARLSTAVSAVPSTSSTDAMEGKLSFSEEMKSRTPSEEFLGRLSSEELSRYQNIYKQVEMYCYMASRVPSTLDDRDWAKLLDRNSVKKRCMYLDFRAVTQNRQETKDQKAKVQNTAYAQYLEAQKTEYENGGMGYGPEMYEMVGNPLRNRKRVNQVEGSRMWATYRLMPEYPQVLLDCQHLLDDTLGRSVDLQLQYLISENMKANVPLPLSLINFPKGEQGKKFLDDRLGFYGGQHTDQTILPDVSTKSARDLLPRGRNVLYISKHAHETLDGPLTADAYVVCMSFDQKRESIGAAKRAGIRPVRLPIQRYVQWKAGPQYIPFPNLMNIFREVLANGGDWKTALHNNIAHRHLVGLPEHQAAIARLKRKTKGQEVKEIIATLNSMEADAQ